MNWAQAVSVDQIGERRYQGHVDEAWTSLQGVHGGVVAAIALTATERTLLDAGVDPTTTLRAATLGYVAGNVVGDLTVDVEMVRRGKSLVTSHASTSQQGKTTTVARFHHSAPWEGMAYSDAPPMPERPAETIHLHRPGTPAHINNVETHLHPDTNLFTGAARAEWIAWSRPLHGSSFDAPWLLMFGDYFPPAVFAKTTAPQRAVTIEYSIQIQSAAGTWDLGDDGYLTARMHAFHSREGFAVEDGWIYHPDGDLLATTRQTRLAG